MPAGRLLALGARSLLVAVSRRRHRHIISEGEGSVIRFLFLPFSIQNSSSCPRQL